MGFRGDRHHRPCAKRRVRVKNCRDQRARRRSNARTTCRLHAALPSMPATSWPPDVTTRPPTNSFRRVTETPCLRRLSGVRLGFGNEFGKCLRGGARRPIARTAMTTRQVSVDASRRVCSSSWSGRSDRRVGDASPARRSWRHVLTSATSIATRRLTAAAANASSTAVRIPSRTGSRRKWPRRGRAAQSGRAGAGAVPQRRPGAVPRRPVQWSRRPVVLAQ